MKILKLSLALLVLGLAATLVLEHRARNQCRELNGELKLALARMSSSSASNTPVQREATASAPAQKGANSELLQLRGRLATLRWQVGKMERLRDENYRLRTNRFNNILKGERLKAEEVAAYLQAQQRGADSLLGAYAATGDRALLREAIEKNPNDPEALFRGYFAFRQDLSSEEKRARLEAFKQAAPDNALAGFVSAREYFNAGQTNAAIGELMAAAQKQKLDDYANDFTRNLEAVYSAVGFSPAETKILAATSTQYPALGDLRVLGNILAELANSYRTVGDEASAQAATQMAMSLGQRLCDRSANGTIIHDLAGLAIERRTLSALNPDSPYDSSGHTVSQYLAEIDRQREAIRALTKFDLMQSLPTMPEADQLEYFERLKTGGEIAALTWAKSKQANP